MSFVGLYTGLTGLRAAQVGMDVTSHNVANASTPGYTRQRVELAARPIYPAPGGMVGTGVDIQHIGRLRDGFLDARFRAAVGDHAGAGVRADLLHSLEALSGEPDQGIFVRLGALWQAAEAWANDPADLASRRQVLSELSAVADTVRSTATAWTALEDDTSDRRDAGVTALNDTLKTLADLNRTLGNADPSRVGADLLDQRDVLLDEVARLSGGTVTHEQNGTVTVTAGGATLLRGNEAATVAVVDGRLQVTEPGGTPRAFDTVGGELGGLQRFLTSEVDGLPAWRGQLNAFASTLVASINGANADGYTSPDTRGGDLLTFDAGDPSGTITLIVGTTVADLAAAGGDDAQPHDGVNARAFADLRTARVAADGRRDPDGASLETRLSDLVVGLAGEVRAARSSASAARAVSFGAELARTSEHGVSIDEEMIGLVRYQRALEANSRVMTAMDEALNVLVNRTGIVGR